MVDMDALVLWDDGTKNVVDISELVTYKSQTIAVGQRVRMFFEKKWYWGRVLAVETMEDSSSDPEDNIPLNELKQIWSVKDDEVPLSTLIKETFSVITPEEEISVPEANMSHSPQSRSPSPIYDSDADPPWGVCEVAKCRGQVWSSCHRCLILLCWQHFLEDPDTCSEHKTNINRIPKQHAEVTPLTNSTEQSRPESFLVEGAKKEGNVAAKQPSINKQKLAKK